MDPQCHVRAPVRHLGLELSRAQEAGCAGGVPGGVVVDARLGADLYGREGDRTASPVHHGHGHLGSLDELFDHRDRAVRVRADHGRRKFVGSRDLAAPERGAAARRLDHHREADLVAEGLDQDVSTQLPERFVWQRHLGRRPHARATDKRGGDRLVERHPAGRTDRTDEWHAKQVEHLAQRAVLTSLTVQDRKDHRTGQLCEPGEQVGVNIGLHDLVTARAQRLTHPAPGAQ